MSNKPGNGETIMDSKGMSDSVKIDILLDAISELTELVQELKTQQEELTEKVANLSLDSDGFTIDSYDN